MARNAERGLRCAIYTRKSTDEGLEQSFNSLDAQREACAAYILSQTHEGWEAVAERYDDGGWSGGTMERPALRQLLGDVRAGKIDIIVVYKVDRLTRSLADFAKIVEILDANGASFVSVTQAFNTTNSMGRLTLNVLLSFAQFEREVTAERIRDKIAASKAKGMWMGGPIPIGYVLQDRKLVADPGEATTVRLIFERYTELRSIAALVDDLHHRGIRSKCRVWKSGRTVGGIPFSKGPLAQLLQNPIYIGKMRHHDQVHDGQHDAIIAPALFNEVQAIIEANRQEHRRGARAASPSLLTGMLLDPDGRPMSPSHTAKGSRRYHYYQTRLPPGASKETAWRLAAGDIDRLVLATIADHLRCDRVEGAAQCARALKAHLTDNLDLADRLSGLPVAEQRRTLIAWQLRVALHETSVIISIGGKKERVNLTVSANLVKRGSDVRLILQEHRAASPDPMLRKLVAQAFAARDYHMDGTRHPCIATYSERYLARVARISWLAPDMIIALLDGTQPPQLTGRRLIRANAIPLDWPSQRAMFGFS
ncbi:MAG: recombinase family protein [Sphingomonadaceae bacterium]